MFNKKSLFLVPVLAVLIGCASVANQMAASSLNMKDSAPTFAAYRASVSGDSEAEFWLDVLDSWEQDKFESSRAAAASAEKKQSILQPYIDAKDGYVGYMENLGQNRMSAVKLYNDNIRSLTAGEYWDSVRLMEGAEGAYVQRLETNSSLVHSVLDTYSFYISVDSAAQAREVMAKLEQQLQRVTQSHSSDWTVIRGSGLESNEKKLSFSYMWKSPFSAAALKADVLMISLTNTFDTIDFPAPELGQKLPRVIVSISSAINKS